MRTNLRCGLALAIAVCLVPPAMAGAAGEPPMFRVVDVMPAFWEAWNAGQGREMPVRAELFRKGVLQRYPQLFPPSVVQADDATISAYLSALAPVIPELRRDGDVLREQLPRYRRGFGEAFPDFNPREITIYVQPSLFHFGGVTGEIDDGHALQFGLDTLASVHADVGVVIAHELFHVYHRQINPTFFATQSENDLYRYGLYREVWAEGLATFVSGALNPAASPAQIFLSDELARLDEPRTRRLACIVADQIDSTSRTQSLLLLDSGEHPDGLPPNGGYLIGDLVAKRLAARRSLHELAALNGDALRTAFGAEVTALCGR